MARGDAYKWIIIIVQECPGYVKGSTTPYNHQPIVSCEAVHAKNTLSTKQTTHSDKYTDISLILDCLHLRAFRNFRTPALNPFQIEDVPPTFTKPIFYIPALSGLLLFYLQQKEIPKNPSNIAWKLPLKIKKTFQQLFGGFLNFRATLWLCQHSY